MVKQIEEGRLVAELSGDGKIIVAVINDRLKKVSEKFMEELRRCMEAEQQKNLQLQDEMTVLRSKEVTLGESVKDGREGRPR